MTGLTTSLAHPSKCHDLEEREERFPSVPKYFSKSAPNSLVDITENM